MALSAFCTNVFRSLMFILLQRFAATQLLPHTKMSKKGKLRLANFCTHHIGQSSSLDYMLEVHVDSFHGDVCRKKSSLDWLCPRCCYAEHHPPYCVFETLIHTPLGHETLSNSTINHSGKQVCRVLYRDPRTCGEHVEADDEPDSKASQPHRAYTGSFDSDGKPHGTGVMTYSRFSVSDNRSSSLP
jgi:hypothetical protein